MCYVCSVTCDFWSVICVVCCMVFSVLCVLCDVLCVMCDVWSVVCVRFNLMQEALFDEFHPLNDPIKFYVKK